MKITTYIFQEMLEKLLSWKFWKIIRKTSLVAFLLKNSSYPIYPPITIAKTDPTQVFPLYALRIFEIAVRAHVVQSLFSKVTETSAFCNSVKKSNTCIRTFDFYLIRRDLALETFRNKFSYLNHSIITSKYKFSYLWKELIIVMTWV